MGISIILILFNLIEWYVKGQLRWEAKQCIIYLSLYIFSYVFIWINRIYSNTHNEIPFFLIIASWAVVRYIYILSYIYIHMF